MVRSMERTFNADAHKPSRSEIV
uniref:Uncharacterized protein n=1 Tax=Rhizophora mucronata TaxID=61149 RepID=A0A2P2PT93_RHIMU